jgi:glycosyltransferase involved in cell wall biosynthesis
MKKILFLSELFLPPYDEGMKVTALNLLKGMRCHVDCIGLGPCGNQNDFISTIPINKLMYSENLRKEISYYNPDFIFYIPEASATLNSFMRYRILQLISNGNGTAMIALQNREYSFLAQKTITMLNPGKLFVSSALMSQTFKKMGIDTHILSAGVDIDKFIPVSPERKYALREEYSIPKEKYVVLHVGHIRASRNVKIFLNLVHQPEIQVVLVGSTSTPQEEELKRELRQAGIYIIDTFIQNNQELYQLADCYVFNVIERSGAIEFPISVLEAIACNLPVVTTPFGSLPENFPLSDDFRYFTTAEELQAELKKVQNTIPKTRERANKFSWKDVAEQLLGKCDLL